MSACRLLAERRHTSCLEQTLGRVQRRQSERADLVRERVVLLRDRTGGRSCDDRLRRMVSALPHGWKGVAAHESVFLELTPCEIKAASGSCSN
jgi:hypothetical protein